MSEKVQTKNPMSNIMGLKDFRLLFAGTAASLLGDQFALIATPWLVLRLTGDPLALGIVLALEGIPRALFMLIGGAVTDRFSPKGIMLISDIVRLLLTALLAAAIFTGIVQMWMLYAFGLGFGLVAGFAVPAENSIVPLIVKENDLQAGNSLIMGVGQIAGFAGPSLAGILIGRYSDSFLGIGLAFALDAVTFAISALCLRAIKTGKIEAKAEKGENVILSIITGLKYLWNDRAMRLMFLVLSAVNFLLMGPLLVGIPVLANQRLPEGAFAFGLLMSAFSGGNLAGFLIAGALPKPGSLVIRLVLIGFLAAFGIIIGSLGFISSTRFDFALLLFLGLGNGYIAILLFTWMQARTPKDMLGRIMSIFMFSNTGLAPVSQAVSGAACRFSLNYMFATAGLLVILVATVSALRPELQIFSASLASIKAAE